MKKILIMMTFIGLINVSTAQPSEHTIKVQGNPQQMTLIVQNVQQDIDFVASDQGEIKITAVGYKGLPEKAKGLMPLSAAGPDNTGLGMNVTTTSDKITITGTHKATESVTYRVSVPKNMRLSVDMNSWHGGNASFKGFTGEVEAKSQIGKLTFVDVTGPLVASTLNAEINVVFSSLNQSSPTSLASTSGDIDVTLPSSAKGNFKFATITGEVYTDLPFSFPDDKGLKKALGGTSMTTALNGGGVSVDIKNISGNIYVRKSK